MEYSLELLSQKIDVIKFHGISRNFLIANLNDNLFPRTSKKFSKEVHGTLQVYRNSMELGDI